MNKGTLELGIEVRGKMGVPFVTKGKAESNLKVTVEYLFPVKKEKVNHSGNGNSFHGRHLIFSLGLGDFLICSRNSSLIIAFSQ